MYKGESINSQIDCDHCKNYWLIKENKKYQVFNAFCKGNPGKTLFDEDIKTKLTTKCK